MSGSCAVHGRRFAQPCRKNWPMFPGPSCSSEPHSSLPGRAALKPPMYDRRVHVIAPEGFDDPGQPTGGNIYDRRVCAGLAEAGWDVLVRTVAAAWPASGPDTSADLARIMS